MSSQVSRTAMRIIFAIVLTAVSLYFAFHQIDLAIVLGTMRAADPWWIVMTIIGMLIAHFSRAMRWRAMLRSMKQVGVYPAFSAVMIGYAINQILPRGGELVRPYLLGRRENLPMSTLLATVVVERVIDVISLVAALLLAVWWSTANVGEAIATLFRDAGMQNMFHNTSLTGIILSITIPTFAGIIVLVWLFFSHRGIAVLEWLAHRAPQRFHARLSAVIARFRDGLHIVRSSGQVEMVLVWTIGVWLGYGLMTWFPIYALHLEHYGLTFGDAFTLMAIITVGRTIAPTPGAIGVYHYFAIHSMTLLYSVSATDAAAFATLSHGVLYVAMIVIGGVMWLVEEFRISDVGLPRSLRGFRKRFF